MGRVRRRDFLFAAGVFLAAPLGSEAQQTKKVHRIGYLSFRAQPGPADKAFVQALSELGYTEGNNLVIEYRWGGMAIELVPQLVTKVEQLPEAFEQVQRAAAQAIIVQLSPFASRNRAKIVGLAAQHRLPAMYESRSFVDDGGLVSYGPDTVETFQRAAMFVDKIFKGANPGDIPVEQPTTFELVINLATAKTLGLVIPQSLLLRADDVIR